MTYINYGDQEPSRETVLRDKSGDMWTFGFDKWETFETAPFAWADMKRSWFPMKVIG